MIRALKYKFNISDTVVGFFSEKCIREEHESSTCIIIRTKLNTNLTHSTIFP